MLGRMPVRASSTASAGRSSVRSMWAIVVRDRSAPTDSSSRTISAGASGCRPGWTISGAPVACWAMPAARRLVRSRSVIGQEQPTSPMKPARTPWWPTPSSRSAVMRSAMCSAGACLQPVGVRAVDVVAGAHDDVHPGRRGRSAPGHRGPARCRPWWGPRWRRRPPPRNRATSAIATASESRRRLSRTPTHCWRTYQRVSRETGSLRQRAPLLGVHGPERDVVQDRQQVLVDARAAQLRRRDGTRDGADGERHARRIVGARRAGTVGATSAPVTGGRRPGGGRGPRGSRCGRVAGSGGCGCGRRTEGTPRRGCGTSRRAARAARAPPGPRARRRRGTDTADGGCDVHSQTLPARSSSAVRAGPRRPLAHGSRADRRRRGARTRRPTRSGGCGAPRDTAVRPGRRRRPPTRPPSAGAPRPSRRTRAPRASPRTSPGGRSSAARWHAAPSQWPGGRAPVASTNGRVLGVRDGRPGDARTAAHLDADAAGVPRPGARRSRPATRRQLRASEPIRNGPAGTVTQSMRRADAARRLVRRSRRGTRCTRRTRPGAARTRAAHRTSAAACLNEPPRSTRRPVRGRVLPAVVGSVRVRSLEAGGPLPDVAGHVQHAVRAGAGREARRPPSCRRTSRSSSPRAASGGRRPTGYVPAVRAPGGLLPLRLGRQADARPGAERRGVAPVDVGHGVSGERRRRLGTLPVGGRAMTRRRARTPRTAAFVTGVRPIDERGQRRPSPRALARRTARRASAPIRALPTPRARTQSSPTARSSRTAGPHDAGVSAAIRSPSGRLEWFPGAESGRMEPRPVEERGSRTDEDREGRGPAHRQRPPGRQLRRAHHDGHGHHGRRPVRARGASPTRRRRSWSSTPSWLVGQDPLRIEYIQQYLYRMRPFRGNLVSGCPVRHRHRALGHQGQALPGAPCGTCWAARCATRCACTCCSRAATPMRSAPTRRSRPRRASPRSSSTRSRPATRTSRWRASSRVPGTWRQPRARSWAWTWTSSSSSTASSRRCTASRSRRRSRSSGRCSSRTPSRSTPSCSRASWPSASRSRWRTASASTPSGRSATCSRRAARSTCGRTWAWRAASRTSRRSRRIAESYHSALVTHNFQGPLITAAAVHVDISIPNFVTQEYLQLDESPRPADAVYETACKRVGGLHPGARGARHRRHPRRGAAGQGDPPVHAHEQPGAHRRLARARRLASSLAGSARSRTTDALGSRGRRPVRAGCGTLAGWRYSRRVASLAPRLGQMTPMATLRGAHPARVAPAGPYGTRSTWFLPYTALVRASTPGSCLAMRAHPARVAAAQRGPRARDCLPSASRSVERHLGGTAGSGAPPPRPRRGPRSRSDREPAPSRPTMHDRR